MCQCTAIVTAQLSAVTDIFMRDRQCVPAHSHIYSIPQYHHTCYLYERECVPAHSHIYSIPQYHHTCYLYERDNVCQHTAIFTAYLSIIIPVSCLRRQYVPAHSHIYCTPQCRPGKPANELKSYQPISLPPVTSKLFEKLLLKRIRNDVGL
jgi:hypothetical protein